MASRATILSLPDDVLNRIFDNLPFQISSPTAPDAFQLSLTCTRLYRFFSTRLHTLHFPRFSSRLPSLPVRDLTPHLSALARLAGPHLLSLRLQRDIITDHVPELLQTLINTLNTHCRNVHTLEFDESPHSPFFLRLHLPVLRNLCVHRPYNVFLSFTPSLQLYSLQLFHLSQDSWKRAAKALLAVSDSLRSLHLSFHPSSNPRWRNYAVVAGFLRQHLHTHFPALCELVVLQAAPPIVREQPMPLSLKNDLAAAFDRAKGGPVRRISISVRNSDALQCLNMFACFTTAIELRLQRQRIFLQ